jgi:hypothetical protein
MFVCGRKRAKIMKGKRLRPGTPDRFGRCHPAGAGGRRPAWRPRVHPVRQRPQFIGEPARERLLRIVSLPVSQQMRQPRATLDSNRSPRRPRGLPPRIERRAVARLSLSATFRLGIILTNSRLRAGPPSRSVPPLGIANHQRELPASNRFCEPVESSDPELVKRSSH